MRTPTSTYRLQVTEEFDLFAAARRLAYLHELGVDWVYLSPLLAAEPGSDHGYDVVAHDRIDPARGGAEGLAALSAEARRLGMGVLVDIVPNHVGVATPAETAWWWDVLRLGQDSAYAPAFDVDWAAGGGRVRVPVVGDDDLLPDGRIDHLEVVDGELRYHDNRFPIAPGTADEVPPGSPAETANAVHARQHYELVGWRAADDELNYRRFFAVNTLAGVRVEDPQVFDDSHAEIRRWFDEGLVDGLRVDHPDGLRDPKGYFEDLARLTGGAYVLVEKILEPGETLPSSWATAGTTGYDALAHIDRVLIDPSGRPALDALEARLRGGPVDWHEMIHGTKRDVADGILQSEVRRIVREILAGWSSRPTDHRGGAARRGGRAARLLPGLPVLPARGARAPRRGVRRRPPTPTGPRRHPRPARARARRSRRRAREAVPADHRHGDGQGRRGLRVLPLLPAHLAQRGRRRPERLRDHADRLPRATWPRGRRTGRTR